MAGARTGALLGLLAMLGSAGAAQVAQPAQADAEADAARTARNLAKTHEVARCLVDRLRTLVVPILKEAPGSTAEQTAVAQLRRRGLRCVEAVSNLKNGAAYVASWEIGALALRGALAEALYEADFSAPSRLRPRDLARVAPTGRTATEAGRVGQDLGDVRRFAACVVRSAQADSVALLESEPGSAAETERVRGLVRDFDACFPTDSMPSINVPTVRGLVAEALYMHRSALARGEPLAPGDVVERGQQARSGTVVIVPAAAVAGTAERPGEGYDAEDVRKLAELSRCIARQRPADAQELLTMDYREDSYARMARWVAGRSMTCVPRGKMRFSRLLFAGGLAEEMLTTKTGEVPAGVSGAAPGTSARAGDMTQSIGFCVARSQPESVARLLATAPASAEENQVVRDLTPHIAKCVEPGRVARIGQPSLRAVAAIAAYRLQQQAAASRPGRG